MSEGLKEAKHRPLLKKIDLDTTFKNYRPVSNLSFVSKLIEKVVREQLTRYTHSTGKMGPLQLAYKVAHLTETALLRVKSDIIWNMNQNKVTCLVLLDLSAAFNSVDHELLPNHLRYRYDVTEQALEWICSYLPGRTQRIMIGNPSSRGAESEKAQLAQGVLQGSVLGPILFTWYVSPLGNICRNHSTDFDSYADDQQNYCAFCA